MRVDIAFASGVSAFVHLAALVAHSLGAEIFKFTGMLFVWELVWGWFTLAIVVFVIVNIPNVLTRIRSAVS